MHRYIPTTEAQRREMLQTLNLGGVEDLFMDIPNGVRLQRPLDLPPGQSEMELDAHMRALAGDNLGAAPYTCFRGAGAYDHYIPAAIDHVLLRQEFYTAYTPYQPEISQGTLQAIFEFQTMICALCAMDVANASVYDAATALGEAAYMAHLYTKRRRILVSRAVNPQSRAVLETYARARGLGVETIPLADGKTDVDATAALLGPDVAAVVAQSPNYFGVVETFDTLSDAAHRHGALLIAVVDPLSLGLLCPPGEQGADIAVGDGQPLGVPLSFGGPYVGFMAAKQGLLRTMPGRIVGETKDGDGARAFVLTMQAREQHIRREKATSNICTNNALMALANTVYLSLMGREGLREAAEQCLQKARYAHDALIATGLFASAFDAAFFREFAVIPKKPVGEVNDKLLRHGILGGYPLEGDYPEMKNGWLVAVTEKRTKAEIDQLVAKAVE
jgi:glycine dehydrogenase subunit 1